jgi:hypothetical protein
VENLLRDLRRVRRCVVTVVGEDGGKDCCSYFLGQLTGHVRCTLSVVGKLVTHEWIVKHSGRRWNEHPHQLTGEQVHKHLRSVVSLDALCRHGPVAAPRGAVPEPHLYNQRSTSLPPIRPVFPHNRAPVRAVHLFHFSAKNTVSESSKRTLPSGRKREALDIPSFRRFRP